FFSTCSSAGSICSDGKPACNRAVAAWWASSRRSNNATTVGGCAIRPPLAGADRNQGYAASTNCSCHPLLIVHMQPCRLLEQPIRVVRIDRQLQHQTARR